jgi:hypothetical protein
VATATRHASCLDRSEPRAGGYVPRRPETTPLYAVLSAELETFLARREQQEHALPRFVARELRGYLDCGILAHGFLRVRCPACREERLVPFSCKGRGFCPSCGGRRMADTAAWLVDRVLPEVPVRQWVLTLPFALRYRLAYDAGLTAVVLREFLRAVFAALRRRARRTCGIPRGQCGAVVFVQRFGDALNLNVHFHALVLDGVYDERGDGRPEFHALEPPSDEELAGVAARIARRVARELTRRGLGPEEDGAAADPLAADEPWLAALAAASASNRRIVGPEAGQPLQRLGDRVDPEDLPAGTPLCVRVADVSLHAAVAVPARDRHRLERLCRYVARPAVASERLEQLEDGRLIYRLKRRWRDGTAAFVFEPEEFVARLAALVPPPRFHLVRYAGVLAPGARLRARIVPEPPEGKSPSALGPGAGAGKGANSSNETRPDDGAATPARGPDPALPRAPRARQPYPWADLMRRVFAVDVLECPRCHGPMRILAAIHPPDTAGAILECLGLTARPPPVAPPRRTTAALFEPDPDWSSD